MASGADEVPETSPPVGFEPGRRADHEGERLLRGLAGSPGVAVGRVIVLDSRRPAVVHRSIAAEGAAAELERYDRAVESAVVSLRRSATAHGGRALPSAAEAVIEAYALLLEDPLLREEVERGVRDDRRGVEWAVEVAVAALAGRLAAAADAYLAERSHDLTFVGERLLRVLSGRTELAAPLTPGSPVVIVARDLSPAETATFDRQRVAALVTEAGTRSSHTAILARALEIPAVVGVSDLLAQVSEGERVVVDGHQGWVLVEPTPDARRIAEERAARPRPVARSSPRGNVTACGVRVAVRANLELPEEVAAALEHGAEGVGLYRSEFLYMDRASPPDEDEQLAVYARVIEAARGLPVTLRTFDIGGDKFASSIHLPEEMNPALGLRAVRLGLARPELLLVQLRAMLRAARAGNARILFPMVSTLEELRRLRALVDEARAGLAAPAPAVPLGIMVEVPSVAILAERFAREADFLSVGTNDLVQYTLAVDRTSPALASLASYLDPAVLVLLRGVADAGRRHGRQVSVCGTMASDPLAALLLIGLGVRELSLEASSLELVREAIARVTVAETEAVARRALEADSAAGVLETVREAFSARLADLEG